MCSILEVFLKCQDHCLSSTFRAKLPPRLSSISGNDTSCLGDTSHCDCSHYIFQDQLTRIILSCIFKALHCCVRIVIRHYRKCLRRKSVKCIDKGLSVFVPFIWWLRLKWQKDPQENSRCWVAGPVTSLAERSALYDYFMGFYAPRHWFSSPLLSFGFCCCECHFALQESCTESFSQKQFNLNRNVNQDLTPSLSSMMAFCTCGGVCFCFFTASTASPQSVCGRELCSLYHASCFLSTCMFVHHYGFEWWQLSENQVLMFFPDGQHNPEAGRPEGPAPPEDAGSRDGSPRVGSPVARASSRARDSQGSSGSDSDSSEDDSDDGVMHRIKSSVTHIKVRYNHTAFL